MSKVRRRTLRPHHGGEDNMTTSRIRVVATALNFGKGSQALYRQPRARSGWPFPCVVSGSDLTEALVKLMLSAKCGKAR
jgi:hypothetical protein